MCFVLMTADSASIGTVSHEATHMVNQVFTYLGQEVDQINDEAQAYLLGYIVDMFMDKIRGVPSNVDRPLKKLKGK